MLKSFETINGPLFCFFCVSYSKALRYMSACTQFAFDCLFWLRTDMCRHLLCTAIFQFCMHDSACFESPPSFFLVLSAIASTEQHCTALCWKHSPFWRQAYIYYLPCHVFVMCSTVFGCKLFFLLFLSMEAPQALRERKLYVALKPDQAACVL